MSGAGGHRRVCGLGDARRPMLHAGEDRDVSELGLERRPRLLGDRVQRRALVDAQSAVALDEVLEQLRPDRPPAADVAVVGGNVGQPLGRAVRHQDHGLHRQDASRRLWSESHTPVTMSDTGTWPLCSLDVALRAGAVPGPSVVADPRHDVRHLDVVGAALSRPPVVLRPEPRRWLRGRTRSDARERPGLFRVAHRAQG